MKDKKQTKAITIRKKLTPKEQRREDDREDYLERKAILEDMPIDKLMKMAAVKLLLGPYPEVDE